MTDSRSASASEPVLPAALLAVDALEADLETLLESSMWQLDDHELAELNIRLERCRNRLDAARLDALHRMEVRGTATTLGATSTPGWVAATSNVRHAAVRADVALSTALHTTFPELRAAVRSGNVSADQARTCVKGLEALPAEVDVDTLERAETHLVELCADYGPTTLAGLCKHLLAVVDPDGPAELERAEQEATRNRQLRVSKARDGGIKLSGWLDAEGGATLMTALDPLAKPRSGADETDLRSPDHRNADALVELSRRMLDSASLPEQAKEKPHLTVTLGLETLRRFPHVAAAELERGGPLSPEAARRLACDSKVIPVVLDGAGVPLDVGREQRTVPRHLRRALVARDGGCAFPGCDRPPAWTAAHHVIHWADGGATTLDNLVLLCEHHHTVIHHSGWRVEIGDDGHPVFTAPGTLPGYVRRPRLGAHRLREELRDVAIPPDPPADEPKAERHDEPPSPRREARDPTCPETQPQPPQLNPKAPDPAGPDVDEARPRGP